MSRLTVAQRLSIRSRPEGECLIWQGTVAPTGYGMISIGSKHGLYVHRVAYEQANGVIPPGMVIDHKCRRRACINPEHLHAVTVKQNGENRGDRKSSRSGRRGVYLHPRSGLWQVQVTHNRKKYSGGYYADIEDAAVAARELRNRLFSNNLDDREASDGS